MTLFGNRALQCNQGKSWASLALCLFEGDGAQLEGSHWQAKETCWYLMVDLQLPGPWETNVYCLNYNSWYCVTKALTFFNDNYIYSERLESSLTLNLPFTKHELTCIHSKIKLSAYDVWFERQFCLMQFVCVHVHNHGIVCSTCKC